MGLKGEWERQRVQRLDEIVERKEKVAQKIEKDRSGRLIMSNELAKNLKEFANNLHETGLEDKKQRQAEIADRKEYVWGS
jgi:replicative DNA helicase